MQAVTSNILANPLPNTKVNKQLHLHATDLEAQGCLSGAGILGFALVNVPLVCGWVPGAEAQLDVYYAWVPISFGHIFQL